MSGRSVGERLDSLVLAPQEDVAVCSRALVEAAFAAAHATLTLAMEMSSVEVLKRVAELDFGVAMVPRFAVQRELDGGTLAVLQLEHFGAALSSRPGRQLRFSS